MYNSNKQKFLLQLCAVCFLIALCYHSIITQQKPVASKDPVITIAPTSSPSSSPTQTPDANKRNYILNMNTKKFHYPNCQSVKQMAEKNKKNYTGTRDEVISKGYSPCKNCDP